MVELKYGSYPLYESGSWCVRRIAWIRPLSTRRWPALHVLRVRVRPTKLASRKAITASLFDFFDGPFGRFAVVDVRHAKRREWLVSISHRH